MENLKNSKVLKWILIGIGALILILVVLRVGVFIGFRQAGFAGRFGENYQRNFMGPKPFPAGGFFNENIPGGHGVAGKIISVNLPQIVVSGTDNLEKTILVSTSTVVRQFRENISSSDLKAGEFIVALGNPNNNGQIEASLIRVMPQPR